MLDFIFLKLKKLEEAGLISTKKIIPQFSNCGIFLF